MNKIIVGTNALLVAAKCMLRRGELTQAQYDEMERRNQNICKERRENYAEVIL